MTLYRTTKPELGVSGLALFQKKEVMEGPLWEMISPLLASDDAVKIRKAGFFQKKIKTMAVNVDRMANFSSCCRTIRVRVPGVNTDTSFDRYEFTPIKKQNSIVNLLR